MKDRPVAPADAMPRYGADLRARPAPPDPRVHYGPFSPRRFDVKRNWALVRALVQDARVDVQYLFCHAQLRQRLLEHAQSIGEDPDVIDRAAALLHQPGDSMPHDDHLHLRIFCSSDDRPFGCVDRGPVRWWKKRYKYMAPGRALDLSELLARLVVNPFPGLRRFVP